MEALAALQVVFLSLVENFVAIERSLAHILVREHRVYSASPSRFVRNHKILDFVKLCTCMLQSVDIYKYNPSPTHGIVYYKVYRVYHELDWHVWTCFPHHSPIRYFYYDIVHFLRLYKCRLRKLARKTCPLDLSPQVFNDKFEVCWELMIDIFRTLNNFTTARSIEVKNSKESNSLYKICKAKIRVLIKKHKDIKALPLPKDVLYDIMGGPMDAQNIDCNMLWPLPQYPTKVI